MGKETQPLLKHSRGAESVNLLKQKPKGVLWHPKDLLWRKPTKACAGQRVKLLVLKEPKELVWCSG